ncbi:MAG TPA: biotin--[acetyl-CoA-carboxylase] ligase [Vicinamibacterales bacterium]|nr:biotin--[acetyl-CoA-carboxylase] ligase [Vicinamibacterales bacterium]
MAEPLPPDLIHALVSAEPRLAGFARLRYFPEVDSTNDIALQLAAAGAPAGTSVLADVQRAGRGRRGRAWFSPPGAGLYLSVVVRLPDAAATLPLLTLAVGVAVADAVSTTSGLPIELKWPNDLVIGRPWRKLGGLLCESTGTGAQVDAVVVGIGINLRQVAYPPEIAERATSIETELGRPIERAALVVETLARVRDAVDRLRNGEGDWVCHEWRRLGRAGLGGASVTWSEQGVAHRGAARDIDDRGALLVETNGRVERLIAGEVTWERLRD